MSFQSARRAITLAGALSPERTSGNRLSRVNVPLAAAERRHVNRHAQRLAARSAARFAASMTQRSSPSV